MTNEHFRLATVRRLAILLNADTIDYTHLTRLAASAVRAPVAYIALLDEPHPHYISAVGMTSDLLTASSAALHNFCRQIATTGQPQSVVDIRYQPQLRHHPAASVTALLAHSGVPLYADTGLIVGALCVADTVPRQWTNGDCALLLDLAMALQREIELREREARSRIFVGEQTDPAYCYLPDGTLTFINDACCQLLGQQRATLLGSDVRRWWSPGERPTSEPPRIDPRDHRQSTLEERPARLADGSTRWLQWTERPILNESGQVVEIQATGHDITKRKQAEEALRASEERFRALSASAPIGIFLTDIAGHCIYGNARLQTILAMDADEIVGSDWTQRVHPDDVEQILVEWKACRRSGQGMVNEYRLVWPDGSIHWARGQAMPLRNDSGALLGYVGTIEDISERRAIEDALRSSEERFRSLSVASPVGIFLTDSQGRCLYSNPRLQAITMLSAEQLLGNGWTERLYPDDAERVVREWQIYARTGREQVTEYRLRWPDGSVHWIRSRNAPLLDDAGELVGHVGTIEDITERRQIEEALRTSEERFRLAVNAIPYPLVMYDTDLRIQFVNTPGLALTGYDEQQLIGQTDETLLDSELTQHYMPTLRRTAALRITQSIECTFRRSKGDRTFLMTYVPLLDDLGNLHQILGIAYDISERSRAEEQRIALERKLLETQKLESLGVLAGGIAHDFNNLLGAILGNADLALLDLPTDSSPYECVAQIKLATQRAADLTQQMLAYSGRGRFIVQRVDLNALIREMHHLLSASIDRTATVHYQLAVGLPPLMADATQLRQVVMNLLTNAAEAIGAAGGVITVRTMLLDADRDYLASTDLASELPTGRYIALSVSDTGTGMEPATLAKIFDPFFTTKFTGRGLGLAAVQGIVRGHHGTLKVQSTPGCGTTFTILLPPVLDLAAAVSSPLGQSTASAIRWQGHGTVLVVDDEPTVRTTAARALERFGFSVLLAADGRIGVELFRNHATTIACVLLDLTMPQLNGAQALQAIRAINPSTRVIVMSGYDEQEVLGRFADAVPDAFLHKPFLPDELQAVLQGDGQPLVH